MDSESQSLETLSRSAFERFLCLSLLAKGYTIELRTSLNDACVRFQMWAFNSNAFQHDQASLQRRALKIPKLLDSLKTRLNVLHEDLLDLEHALACATKEDMATFMLSRQARLEEHAPIILEHTEDDITFAQDYCLDSFELVGAINEDISALFKISALVKMATLRTPRATALAILGKTQVDSEEIDVEPIDRHFSQLKQPALQWLRLRLAKANCARREYLEACEVHQTRQAAFSARTLSEGRRDDSDQKPQASRVPDADLYSFGQDLTAQDWQKASPDNVHHDSGHFTCPYCKLEQLMASETAWRRHAFDDLKAYVCTAEDCEVCMFGSSEAWMVHQLSQHLVAWSCPICKEHPPFSSASVFQAHMRLCHTAEFSEGQISQLTHTSKHSVDSIKASECPFCDWATDLKDSNNVMSRTGEIHVTLEKYRRHVCSHLEQLALAAVDAASTASKSAKIAREDGRRNDDASDWTKDHDLEQLP